VLRLVIRGARWHRLLKSPGGIRKSFFKLFLQAGKELAVLRSNGKLFQTSGELPNNNICLTQCYRMVHTTERRCTTFSEYNTCAVDQRSEHRRTVCASTSRRVLQYLDCWLRSPSQHNHWIGTTVRRQWKWSLISRASTVTLPFDITISEHSGIFCEAWNGTVWFLVLRRADIESKRITLTCRLL